MRGGVKLDESLLFSIEKWICFACLNMARVVVHEAIMQAKLNGNASHCKSHKVKMCSVVRAKHCLTKAAMMKPMRVASKAVLLPVHHVFTHFLA